MIDRCVCFKVTFAALIKAARAEGIDFDALSERTKCGKQCGLCVPFIRASLDQGKTVFSVQDIPNVQTAYGTSPTNAASSSA